MAGFVCIYYGNTGSSWLVDALDGSPAVWVPGFEPIEHWAWQAPAGERLAWLETLLSPPADRDGGEFREWLEALHRSPQASQDPVDRNFKLTGLKMADLAVVDPDALIDVLKRTDSKVIHLVRNNRLKHALSMYRYHDEAKSQFHGKDDYTATKVNSTLFKKWLKESERLHTQGVGLGDLLDERLGTHRVTHLAYEDFTDAPGKQATLAHLAEFLDIPAEFGDGSFIKATPDSLKTAIANYRTFYPRYRFTKYAPHLD